MPTPSKYTPEERARALRLYKKHPARYVQEKTGVPIATLSRWGKEAGIKRPRAAHVRAANEARSADFAARRTRLKEELLTSAEKLHAQLFSPCTVYNFGGKDNTFAEQDLDEPGYRDKKEICVSLGILVDKVGVLDKMEAPKNDVPDFDRFIAYLKSES